ncbi:MAG: glycine--tRNA ligase subunit beta, partial [Firmicutes bacterium]|nr:glycine--tRNA ligase subunit beta [Bacillota bacterium]
MQDFLLELGFEELPARFVLEASRQLTAAVVKELKEGRLKHGEVRSFSTPRRLAVLIRDVVSKQADLIEEIKGPPKSMAYDHRGNL